MLMRVTPMRFVMAGRAVIVLAVLLCMSPALGEGSASGSFPDRTFFVTRSGAGGPQSAFTVEILPQTTGEWWVTADSVAGAYVTVNVWRNDAVSPVPESSSKLRFAGDSSTPTLLTAGILYSVTFTQFGKPGTSVLREGFSWLRQFGTAGYDVILDTATRNSLVYAVGFETTPGFDAFLRKFDTGGGEVWTRHFVTSSQAVSLAIDGTGVYVAGWGDALPGQSSGGIFLRKYDFDGNELWTRQFSTGSTDNISGVAVDGTSAYLAGWTFGTFPGESSSGDGDAYLRKYDPDGNEMWTRQFGTSAFDAAYAIDADPSGIYVGGSTGGVLAGGSNAGQFDVFVARYDSDGNEVWTRQFGAAGYDYPSAIDVAGAGVYVAGKTAESSSTDDAFIRKYDPDGNELWSHQFGTSFRDDEAFGISANATGVFVTGWTDGTLPGQTSAGLADAFVRKYDLDGNELWTRQFGTPGYDVAHDVEASGPYVAGRTDGAFPGQSSAGGTDAFLARLPP